MENLARMLPGSVLLFVTSQLIRTKTGISLMFCRAASRLLTSLFVFTVLCQYQPLSVFAQDDAEAIKVSDSPSRTWSSPDGKFKREGTLVEIIGDRVKLEMADGKSTVAQAAKLSKADQSFIESERKRMEASGDSPFMDEDEGGDKSAGASSALTTGKEIDIDLDYATVSVVELASEVAADIDPQEWNTTPQKKVKSFRIPAYTVHASITGFACSPGEKMFAVSLSEPFGVNPNQRADSGGRRGQANSGGGDIKAWVDIVDLETTKTKFRFPLAAERDAVGDVNDEGNLIVTFGGWFAQEPKVRIMSVSNEGLEVQKSWSATSKSDWGAAVKAAGFLPGKRLLVDYSTHLLVLKLDPVEVLFKIPKDDTAWEISRDRTKAIVERQNKRYLIDLSKGECIGVVGGAASNYGSPSPNGSRIVKFQNFTMILSSESGEKLDEFYCPVFWPEPSIRWVDDRTVMLQTPNQQFYIDVDRRVVFLEVLGTAAAAASRGGWVVQEMSDGGPQTVQISQVSATKNVGPNLAEYRQDLPDDADSLLLLKAGDSVRITAQLTADPSQETIARQKVGELLQKRGVTIDPNAANELRLSSAVRNEQVEYRSVGAPFRGGSETVNVRLVDQAAELIVDGQMVWRAGSTSGPGFMLQMREGETAQQAADRQSSNGNAFWASISLPKNLAKHPNGGAWHRAAQTRDGLQKMQ